MVVVDVTKDCATAAAADAVFLIEIKIDQGVKEVGSSSRSSIRYSY